MANFTKLLLHLDGADGSTTITDSSIYAHSVTAGGNAQIDTAQAKFNQSCLFDGTGDYLTNDGGADFAFSTGDFTIDFWVRFAGLPGANVTLYESRPSGTNGAYPVLYKNASHQLIYFANSADQITSTTTFVVDTWYHIAVARSGTSTKMFISGTQEGSTYSDSTTYIIGTSRPAIGIAGDLSSNPLNGWIDELRVSKGIARWTANFTPPTEAYTVSSTSSSSSSCRSSSSSSRSSSSSSSCSSSSSSCRSSSSSSSCSSSSSSRSSSSSSRSSSSSSSSSRSSSSSSRSSSSSSCRSSSSSSCSSSSSSSCRSSSSSSCRSSSSSSSCRSSSSSSCRSSSSSCRSSSSSCSSMSHTVYKPEGINKVSSTITYEQDKQSEYVGDVDSDLKTVFAKVNQGFKPQRFTTAQRNAITELFTGMIIVNVSTNKLNWYTPLGAWSEITSS